MMNYVSQLRCATSLKDSVTFNLLNLGPSTAILPLPRMRNI